MAADRALPRVVSLIASSTEIVCALGCEETLVGRSHECDWPRSVLRLPAVSRPAFLTSGSSRAVDLALKERLARALSVYEVDAGLLKRLAPDLIITQTQCEVCAVSPADVERAVCELTDRSARILALEPNGLDDVWADIARVAEALGVGERGAELVRRLQWRVADIQRRVAALQARPRITLTKSTIHMCGYGLHSSCSQPSERPHFSRFPVRGQEQRKERAEMVLAAQDKLALATCLPHHPCLDGRFLSSRKRRRVSAPRSFDESTDHRCHWSARWTPD